MSTETDLDLKALFEKAHAAGMAKVNPAFHGCCGFAWVTIHPANSKAAKYAKQHLDASKGYAGGMEIWISDFGQSLDQKEAYAHGFAAVLKEAGIKAIAGSRMD